MTREEEIIQQAQYKLIFSNELKGKDLLGMLVSMAKWADQYPDMTSENGELLSRPILESQAWKKYQVVIHRKSMGQIIQLLLHYCDQVKKWQQACKEADDRTVEALEKINGETL